MKVWELIQLLYDTAMPDADVELIVSQRVNMGGVHVNYADFIGSKDIDVVRLYPSDVQVVTIEAYE